MPSAISLHRFRLHAETYLARAANDYPDVLLENGKGTVGLAATAELAGLANVPSLVVGKSAPEVKGIALGGKNLKLSDHKGKVVVLVFWVSWYNSCMAEAAKANPGK